MHVVLSSLKAAKTSWTLKSSRLSLEALSKPTTLAHGWERALPVESSLAGTPTEAASSHSLTKLTLACGWISVQSSGASAAAVGVFSSVRVLRVLKTLLRSISINAALIGSVPAISLIGTTVETRSCLAWSKLVARVGGWLSLSIQPETLVEGAAHGRVPTSRWPLSKRVPCIVVVLIQSILKGKTPATWSSQVTTATPIVVVGALAHKIAINSGLPHATSSEASSECVSRHWVGSTRTWTRTHVNCTSSLQIRFLRKVVHITCFFRSIAN